MSGCAEQGLRKNNLPGTNPCIGDLRAGVQERQVVDCVRKIRNVSSLSDNLRLIKTAAKGFQMFVTSTMHLCSFWSRIKHVLH